jgi:hypothetical protein
MPLPGGLVRVPTEPQAAREHLVQIVPIVHLVQKCVRRTSSVARSTQDTPRAGGSNPGPKRSGPIDGALPVEVHLSSWGRGRARLGAEAVRIGSQSTSRLVPKKPSRMPLLGDLVRSPTEPQDARAHRGVVPLVLRTPRAASPTQDTPVRGGLKSRSEAVRTGVGRFLGLDAPLPSPSPTTHCRDPPQFPGGVWGELNSTPGRHRQAYPLEALACLKFPASRTDNDKMNLSRQEPL